LRVKVDLEDLRARWLKEGPSYQTLAESVKEQLATTLRSVGVYAELTARGKQLDSLLKKAIRKKYSDPWTEIVDKAGVRAVVRFIEDVEPVCMAIRTRFTVIREESKGEELAPHEFGYLGTHFDILVEDAGEPRQCEIQVHTACQNVWATLSHLLAYKTTLDLPKPVMRSLHRASALLESADEGFSLSHRAVVTHPEFQHVAFLTALEKHFFRFVARDYDAELSLLAVKCLMAAYTKTGDKNPLATLEEFVTKHATAIATVYQEYGQVPERSAFLFQPEALAVFERLETDQYAIKEEWTKFEFPVNELERLAQVWGLPLEE
jgi:ppGpp synthetase/RelA/SpoT-type nucleotidyltranferase